VTDAAPLLYVNGSFVPEGEARLSALDRGFTLADGVFETMVAQRDRVFRLREHMARMRQSASILGLHLPPARTLTEAVIETLRRNAYPWGVVRATVSRGPDPGRGLDIPRGLAPTVLVRVTPWAGPSADLPPGRALALSTVRRNETSPLSQAKSLAYSDGVVARQEARRRGADDALLLNTRGFVACATSSNLFVALDGVLITPPVEDGALAGIARRTVMEEALRLGMVLRERSLTVEEVALAEEAFLTNVVTGPAPVVSLDGRGIGLGGPGPLTERLIRVYWERVRRQLGRA